jgi:hypothetical protein
LVVELIVSLDAGVEEVEDPVAGKRRPPDDLVGERHARQTTKRLHDPEASKMERPIWIEMFARYCPGHPDIRMFGSHGPKGKAVRRRK